MGAAYTGPPERSIMLGFLSLIFVIVFVIVNKAVLTAFEIGVLILMAIAIETIEYSLYTIWRYLKNERNR